MEPQQLRRGKAFHKRVQAAWVKGPDGPERAEQPLLLHGLPKRGDRIRRGHVDVFFDKQSDFVSIFEIKSTNWDAIKPTNRRRLLGAHKRQILRYVDEYLDYENVSVCAVMIYPKPPHSARIRKEVESYINEHAIQVFWYEDNAGCR